MKKIEMHTLEELQEMEENMEALNKAFGRLDSDFGRDRNQPLRGKISAYSF